MFIEKNDKGNNTNYIEFQVCYKCLNTSHELLVKVDSISFNVESSIYIDFLDYEKFISIYGIYFNNCMHNNLSEGALDPYGINYFSLDKTKLIIEKISTVKPFECEKLIDFLNKAKDNNGFYILGI